MMDIEKVGELACPACRSRLRYSGDTRGAMLSRGHLACAACGAEWRVEDGLCRLYREQEVRGSDRFMRFLYDRLAHLHDPAVKYTLPLFQSGTERQLRDGYLRRMELHALTPRAGGRPARILDVGFGTGADLPFLRRALPAGMDVEIWGVDLSLGMMSIGRRRLSRLDRSGVQLLLADAHALPFPDASFDRVFHIGGIAGYRDPARALAEMARVAMPGTPIVVVDEQLDPRIPQTLYNRLTFRLVTFYDPAPHCPLEHVPERASEVRAEQLSRFFYCMTFRC
jgi:ubiquinone/menaquinone biosynthesis C-methylase UbiE/uncharacterized protein YbaR (Trm112 family)